MRTVKQSKFDVIVRSVERGHRSYSEIAGKVGLLESDVKYIYRNRYNEKVNVVDDNPFVERGIVDAFKARFAMVWPFYKGSWYMYADIAIMAVVLGFVAFGIYEMVKSCV